MPTEAIDVLPDLIPTPGAGSGAKRRRRPIRDNLEAFGVAILMAVLLKYFAIEAYQIPTSSMQPTLMGSPEAGINDRILVDKVRYEIFEPQRWDVAVFRYPIRQNQNYVKRIVGMPGDHLLVAGGNIYDATDEAAPHVRRKPDDLQERIWKNVYPLRRDVNGSPRILGPGGYFDGRGGAATWSEQGDDLVADVPSGARTWLDYTDEGQGGISNVLWDGYPTDVARILRQKDVGWRPALELVQDMRFTTTVEPRAMPASLQMQLTAGAPAEKPRRFLLVIEGGKAHLEAQQEGKDTLRSADVPFELAAGAATRVSFAHVDDHLLAWRDGSQVAELDTSAMAIMQPILAGAGGTGSNGNGGTVRFSMQVTGGDHVRFAAPRLDRDLHYMWYHPDTDLYAIAGTPPHDVLRTKPLIVPAGHYFMMGDNTMRSADSREWTAITVGLEPQPNGPLRMVDPLTVPESQRLVGNKRGFPPSEHVDADENPVILPGERIAFTDAVGDVYALRGQISTNEDRNYQYLVAGQMWFQGDHGPWHPLEEKWHFVRREHILGRALLTFWPTWPFGPQRVGFIR